MWHLRVSIPSSCVSMTLSGDHNTITRFHAYCRNTKKCFVWVFNCVSRWWTQQHRSLKYKRIEGENRAQVWPRLSFWGRRGMHVQDYHHHHHHLLLFFEGNEGEPSIMHRPAFFIACLWDLIINRMWVGWQVRSALSELTSEADRS